MSKKWEAVHIRREGGFVKPIVIRPLSGRIIWRGHARQTKVSNKSNANERMSTRDDVLFSFTHSLGTINKEQHFKRERGESMQLPKEMSVFTI